MELVFRGLISTLCAACAFSAEPVASVFSAAPFSIDGYPIRTPGVVSFPLVVGDTITTLGGGAILLFEDGSRVKLGPKSSIRISGAEGRERVVLLAGALDFKLIPGSAIAVVNLDAERDAERRLDNERRLSESELPFAPAKSRAGVTNGKAAAARRAPKQKLTARELAIAGAAQTSLSLPPIDGYRF